MRALVASTVAVSLVCSATAASQGRATMPFSEPTDWPEYLPPYSGSGVFAPNGLLWIPRLTAAGRPPLYDIVNRDGVVVERVELPPRTKLIGFGSNSVYIARFDQDDLQYLQRHALPTTERP